MTPFTTPVITDDTPPPAANPGALTASDISMFARFRIPVDLLRAAGIERVTDQEARERYGLRGPASRNANGIVLPYPSPITGQRVTCRLRRDYPEYDDEGKPETSICAPTVIVAASTFRPMPKRSSPTPRFRLCSWKPKRVAWL